MKPLGSLLFWAALGMTRATVQESGKSMESLKDASEIRWAHGVNSLEALERELGGYADFLEADVSMGHLTGQDSTVLEPVMAHPPDTTSDVTLKQWMRRVIGSGKGVKLDFKSLDAVEPSLRILEIHIKQITFPLWLNADVLPGPVDSITTPVPVDRFLALCHQYFPNATLSIGWTTLFHPLLDFDKWQYEWHHVRQMVDVLSCNYGSSLPTVTFPVRGIYAARSIQQLKWLLGIIPQSTLTVWSAPEDPLDVEDLLNIRRSFPKDKVFYDVPLNVNKAFQKKKKQVSAGESHDASGGKWLTVTHGQRDSCSSLTYLNESTVAFGRSLPTSVLTKTILTSGQDIQITGFVEFFGFQEPAMGVHELKIVLADVSSFAQNSSISTDLTVSDTDVLWRAMNDSVIHTFRHPYVRKESSCRFFKLDTASDKSFEVYTVPCAVASKASISISEIKKAGIPEISPRKRLILPRKPFMFGMMSVGDEYVVVHRLKIEASSSSKDSALQSLPKLTMIIFSVVASITIFAAFNLL